MTSPGPVTPDSAFELLNAIAVELNRYSFEGTGPLAVNDCAAAVIAAVRPLIEAETLTAFEAKLGRAVERIAAAGLDRKTAACQRVGLLSAKLMAIEAADKAQRGELW